MKFEEVLPALREGKKIRRKNIIWQNYYGFLFISEIENEIFSDSVVDCHYRITKEDLNTDDWEIVEEPLLMEEKKLLKGIVNNSFTPIKNICFIDYLEPIENEENFINIIFYGEEEKAFELSVFDTNKFEKIEFNKDYTLGELGLE